MNNFDQSSMGVNLELNIFYDNDLSRIYFEDNFKRDQYVNDYWHFIDHGNFEEIDLLDLSNYDFTKKDLIIFPPGKTPYSIASNSFVCVFCFSK